MVKNNPENTFLKYSFNSFPQLQTDLHHLLSPIYCLCRKEKKSQLNYGKKVQDSVSKLPHQNKSYLIINIKHEYYSHPSYNNALILKRETVGKLHTKVEGKLEVISFLLLIKRKRTNQSSF